MSFGALEAVGGVGLFLIGMILMTDGLRGIAGDALHRLLRRFTHSPLSGAVSGALATSVVQSSSATTVAAVGFASAGLLTFSQSVGIVLGANIGTTMTGWMVALVGFKLDLGTTMPLLVLAGALLRLFGRGRLRHFGLALAGFGLVFVGIDALQSGAQELREIVTPERFPEDTWTGRFLLVLIGMAVTVVTQSSSAGVATALAALTAGSISFQQAAAMVIGMDVGTTVTALMATAGASLEGRRTGYAHTIYNSLTAFGAFWLLPLYVWSIESVWDVGITLRQPQIALVAFHTLFNTLGVSVTLTLIGPFTRLVEWVAPERPAPFTARLDRQLLGEPDLALRAVAPTLTDLAARSLEMCRDLVVQGRASPARREKIGLLQLALAHVQRYVASIDWPEEKEEAGAREVAALHVVDQLRRLLDRLEQSERIEILRSVEALRELGARLVDALGEPKSELGEWPASGDEAPLAALAETFGEGRRDFREGVMQAVARGRVDPESAVEILDARRWLERVTHHAWRVVHHLDQLRRDEPSRLAVEPEEPE